MAAPRHWNRTPNQVYYEDPSSSTVQLRGIVRSAATFALQSGLLTDVGHCLYIVNDNRRQWELTGESTPWTKSLAWAFLRSFGGQVISGLLTKSTPSFLQRPKTHTLIVLASWAAVNYSKDDRFFRVINRRWGRAFMNFMEALWKSSEVVRGVDSFLKRFPNYHLAALALGMISGCGGTMLMNWSRRFPLVKESRKADWIVKTCLYCSILYTIPTSDSSFRHPRTMQFLVRVLFVWAYLFRAFVKDGDLFRPVENVCWRAARVISDLSDGFWHT